MTPDMKRTIGELLLNEFLCLFVWSVWAEESPRTVDGLKWWLALCSWNLGFAAVCLYAVRIYESRRVRIMRSGVAKLFGIGGWLLLMAGMTHDAWVLRLDPVAEIWIWVGLTASVIATVASLLVWATARPSNAMRVLPHAMNQS